MDFRKWLAKSGLSQREVARRLGYSTNGPLSKVASGIAYVPPDAIPTWADALELTGKNREDFIREASDDAMPDWVLATIKDLRARLSVASAMLGGTEAEPTKRDLDLCHGDARKARILAIHRRVHQYCADRIAEAEGRKVKPRMTGSDDATT